MILTQLVFFKFFGGASPSDAPVAATPATADVGGGGKRRKHPEYVVWEEPEKAPDISAFAVKVQKAIRKVLAKAPPDDSIAIRSLRNELSRLRVQYRPEYARAMLQVPNLVDIERQRQEQEEDDIEVLLLLH